LAAFQYVNSGGRYDPGTDSWTATNTTNAPTGRGSHTAVWIGGEMIVWGGAFYDNALRTIASYYYAQTLQRLTRFRHFE
jgi:hypothetical protein